METKRKELKTFLVGFITLFLIIALVVWGIVSIINGIFFPKMLFPDDIIVDTTDISATSLNDFEGYDSARDYNSYVPDGIVYNGFLANFTMHSFPVFTNGDEIPDEYLISFGLWEALKSEKFKSEIKMDKQGNCYVPSDTVERAAMSRFVFTKKLEMTSVNICGQFEYNTTEKAFIVPLVELDDIYLPRVTNVSWENEVTIISYENLSSKDIENSLIEEQEVFAVNQYRVTLTGTTLDYRISSYEEIKAQ